MSKIRFYKADYRLIKFLKENGFKHRHINSNKEYYVNDRGNQVRIDRNKNEITLLNNKGYVVDSSNVYTEKKIKEFAGRDN